MLGIIDRFEGEYIVVESEDKIYSVKKDISKENLQEGDVVNLEIKNKSIVSIKKNLRETQKRKEYIVNLTKDMWNY